MGTSDEAVLRLRLHLGMRTPGTGAARLGIARAARQDRPGRTRGRQDAPRQPEASSSRAMARQ